MLGVNITWGHGTWVDIETTIRPCIDTVVTTLGFLLSKVKVIALDFILRQTFQYQNTN